MGSYEQDKKLSGSAAKLLAGEERLCPVELGN
jgi:hypothetical protein